MISLSRGEKTAIELILDGVHPLSRRLILVVEKPKAHEPSKREARFDADQYKLFL